MNIRKRLIVFSIILGIVPVIISTSICITNFNDKSIEMIKQNVIASAHDQAKNLEYFFNENVSDLKITASIPVVRELLIDSNNKINIENKKNNEKVLNEIFSDRTNQQFYLSTGFLINNYGIIISSSDNEYINTKVILSSEELDMLKNNEVIVTNIIERKDFNKGIKSVIIASPIFFENQYQGSIASVINMNYFENIVNNADIFRNKKIILMDKNGTIAASNTMDATKSIMRINTPNNLYEQWKKIDFVNNPNGIIEYNINKVEEIGYYSTINNTGWTVLNGAEWAEVKAPIENSIRNIISFLTFILIIIIASYIFAINYFSKPIYKLLEVIRKIKQGNFKDRFIYDEDNEFGEIAIAFNDLIDAIEKNRKDITESKITQEELRLSEERYRIIMSQTEDIIFEWNIKKDTVQFSENWKSKFNYDSTIEDISMKIYESNIIYKDDIKKFGKILNDIIYGDTYQETEIRFRKSNDKYIWCKIRITAMFDENGNIFKAMGAIIDIDKEKIEAEKLLFKAQRDSLTGLYNKGTVQSMIEEYMENEGLNSKGALFVIDIDDFKAINDNLGHLAGDFVLTGISSMFSEVFNESSIIGRIGGDEFIVFLKNIDSEELIYKKAEDLVKGFRKDFVDQDSDYKVAGSIGIAKYPEHGKCFKELFISADKAVYLSKAKGKDTYCVFEEI